MAGRSWSGLRSPAMAFRWPLKRGFRELSPVIDRVSIVDETVGDA